MGAGLLEANRTGGTVKRVHRGWAAPHGRGTRGRVEVNRGGPGNPLSDEELARKFHDDAVRSLPEERAAELAAQTLALPDAQSVEDLTGC